MVLFENYTRLFVSFFIRIFLFFFFFSIFKESLMKMLIVFLEIFFCKNNCFIGFSLHSSIDNDFRIFIQYTEKNVIALSLH